MLLGDGIGVHLAMARNGLEPSLNMHSTDHAPGGHPHVGTEPLPVPTASTSTAGRAPITG